MIGPALGTGQNNIVVLVAGRGGKLSAKEKRLLKKAGS
eukprot:SAG31_NODE_37394_length_304_cov_1.268293_1_plen_37_part_01